MNAVEKRQIELLIDNLEDRKNCSVYPSEYANLDFVIDELYKILVLDNGEICKDCGKSFVLSESEFKFFTNNNLFLPKRCSDCREKRKEKR